MLVSENGTVISNVSISEKNELARYTSVEGLAVNINNQKFIVDAQKINYTNWHIVRAYDYSKYIEEAHRQKLQSFMIPAVCITFFVMLILYVIHKTNKPIHKLIKAANRVSEKDFSVRLPKNRMGELEIVYSVFNSMLDTFESLLQENERKQNSLLKEQKKKNDYKFKMLQSQINPHFLLNVLNNIKWMALINKADNVADMLMALGNLLNASMGKTADEVIIEEELQYVNDYVKLQKMRYGDSFNISMEIDPEIKQFFVIKLLLQPIVENAIIHGCVIANRYGYIQIIGKEEDGDIVFLVRDNGTGMTKEEIEKLSQPETEQNNSSQHIGLYGTNDRIKLYYGSSYGISVVSDEKGTTVKIRIPKRLYQSDNVDK